MVGVGIEKPDPTVQVSTTIGFAPAFLAVTNIIFAYAGSCPRRLDIHDFLLAE
jgi:hypothetical protein